MLIVRKCYISMSEFILFLPTNFKIFFTSFITKLWFLGTTELFSFYFLKIFCDTIFKKNRLEVTGQTQPWNDQENALIIT